VAVIVGTNAWAANGGAPLTLHAKGEAATGGQSGVVLAVADEAARHPGSRFALFKPLFPILVMNCHRRWQRRLAR
jgi:hypothetical protein